MDYYGLEISTCYGQSLEYNKTHDKKLIDELGRTLSDIGNHSVLLTNVEKIDFFNLYKARLYYIAQTLRMMKKEFPRHRIPPNNIFPHEFINTILEQKFMYVTYTTHLLDFIAIMMREFMKGITYFQRNSADEIHDRPIYHRTLSCGNRGSLHELDCTGFYDDAQEFLRRSLKTRKCTIERHVYDLLFQIYFPMKEQNFRHQTMALMSKREEYFNKCFPSTTIDISVIFNQDGIAKELEILQCNPNKIIVEKYVKQINQGYNRDALNWNDIAQLNINEIYNIYGNDVVGRRLIYDREQHIKIYSKKIQSFINPIDRWEPDDLAQLGQTNSFTHTTAKSQLNTKIRSETSH